MQPCTIHAARPSLLISRPARLTRFDLRFMTTFDIPRETALQPPWLAPFRPSRPRPMICASFSVTFFLSYRYFYHYLCSPMLSPGIYAGWIIIRGFLRLADAKCCSLFVSWKMDSVRQFNATQLGGIFVTDFVCTENKIPIFEIIVVLCGIVYTDFN